MAEPGEALGIVLISGGHERAHYALVLATGAAALGRSVILFATNQGCHALRVDWSGLADAGRDAAVRAAGVAGFDELRDAAVELGVRLMVCESGLAMAGLAAAPGLLDGVERSGVVGFLHAVGPGRIVTL